MENNRVHKYEYKVKKRTKVGVHIHVGTFFSHIKYTSKPANWPLAQPNVSNRLGNSMQKYNSQELSSYVSTST